MAHQQSSPRMAPGAARDDLTRRVADAIRQLRRSVPAMSEEESQLLSDYARGRNLTYLCKLFGVTERSFREADALAVIEAMRGHVLERRRHRAGGLVGLLDALCEETASNGPADVAPLAFIIAPSPATKDAAIEAFTRQEVATRVAIDALHTTDVHGIARSLAQIA